MKAIAFDTLEFAKRLRAAEFTEKQAETLAAAMAEIIESRLATKEDIALLQRNVKEDFALVQRNVKEDFALVQRDAKEMELRLREDMALMQRDLKELELRLKHDLTLRLGAMLAAGIGIIATLVKLL